MRQRVSPKDTESAVCIDGSGSNFFEIQEDEALSPVVWNKFLVLSRSLQALNTDPLDTEAADAVIQGLINVVVPRLQRCKGKPNEKVMLHFFEQLIKKSPAYRASYVYFKAEVERVWCCGEAERRPISMGAIYWAELWETEVLRAIRP